MERRTIETEMDDDRRYKQFLQRDRASDGKFLTGVLTTGIYCLPSCPARRPKRENVRFFKTPDEARESGLRPCHRCHPDWFYRGEEWYENLYEQTVARVRGAPDSFPGISAIGAAAGHEPYGAQRPFPGARARIAGGISSAHSGGACVPPARTRDQAGGCGRKRRFRGNVRVSPAVSCADRVSHRAFMPGWATPASLFCASLLRTGFRRFAIFTDAIR